MRLVLTNFIFTFVLATLLASPLSAQDTNNTKTRPEKIQNKPEAIREKVTARREEVKLKAQERRAELKTKLAEFRDQKKAEIAERADKKLDEINSRKTSHMAELLSKMNGIVTKLESRLDEAQASGRDVSQALVSLEAAKAAIATAQEAVETQAGTDYGIETTDESSAKSDFKGARNALHNDLKSTHEKVVAARFAVAQAISSAKSSLKGETRATPTP